MAHVIKNYFPTFMTSRFMIDSNVIFQKYIGWTSQDLKKIIYVYHNFDMGKAVFVYIKKSNLFRFIESARICVPYD